MGKGISPDTFGPNMWATIHYICLGSGNSINGSLDTVKQNSITQFFTLLPSIIPCDSCNENLPLELKKNPIDNHLGNSEDLFKWSVAIHNSVNRRLGKPEVSVEKAKTIWLSGYNKTLIPCGENNTGKNVATKNSLEKYFYFILGLLIGIAIYFALSRMKM